MTVEELRRLNQDFFHDLATFTGRDAAEICAETACDKHFSAAEAVEYGLADLVRVPADRRGSD